MAKKLVEDNREKITVELKDKIVVLSLEPFDADVDMDDFCKIHYHNIMGEILTCSVALNRIGNLLAEYESLLAETQLDFDIFYAQKFEEFQKELTRDVVTSRSERKELPSSTAIDMAIVRTPEYKVKKFQLIKLIKNKEIIKSFYWSVHSKNSRLDKISDKLRPDEFEKDLVEEKINGVLIKAFKKTID